MTLDEYQQRAAETAIYPEAGTGSPAAVLYAVASLIGEVGEVAGKAFEAFNDVFSGPDTEVERLLWNAKSFGKEAGLLSKRMRDRGERFGLAHDAAFPAGALDGMRPELGDCLWHVAQLATELQAALSDVAAANLAKLASRKARGTLKGSGDER